MKNRIDALQGDIDERNSICSVGFRSDDG